MISGTRPAKHIYKLRTFRHAFGAPDISHLGPFNVDPGLTMPDQIEDKAYTACVGYTDADYLVDIFHKVFVPDFSYAAALFVEGVGPTIGGASFHAGMEAVVAVGGAAEKDRLGSYYTSAGKGELYISDWRNWPQEAKSAALKYAQPGVRNVLDGSMSPFDAIILAAYQTGKGVSMGSPWNQAFNGKTAVDGMTANPVGIWHNYAGKGLDVTATWGALKRRLAVKSWQGKHIGDRGWLYFDEDTVNNLMAFGGAGALAIDASANRWASILGIALRRFPGALQLLPQLLKAKA